MAGADFVPGTVALITADGSARQVADGVAFPNGMASTADNSALIVAESYGRKLTAFDIEVDGGLSNRRVWADLGDGVTAARGAPTANNGWFRTIDTDGSIGTPNISAVSFQIGCGEANQGCAESCSCQTIP